MKQRDDIDIRIRYMTIDDIDAVMNVEHRTFSMPWSESAFYYELGGNRFAAYFVVEAAGQVIGYCGCWVVIDKSQITNIALLPEYRGYKIGESLLRTSMQYARMRGAKQMSLEVRRSNTQAQNLYYKLGFRTGGVHENYYTNDQEDALIMWVTL